MNKVIGYTTGVFDMFHIGHLNILKKAKENCDYLIVGVTTDELCLEIKNKKPVISFGERIEIINQIKVVDRAVPENINDKLVAHDIYKFNRIFKGSDWKGSEKWNKLEVEFKQRGVEVVYFNYTKGTSSTLLKKKIEALI